MSKVTVLAIDLAKQVFQVHGVDCRGVPVLRRQLRRAQMQRFLAQLEPCIVVMEACAAAHHWARQAQACGHEARLIAPQYVKPFVKGNKTDRNDAEAIGEAAQRPNMRFVPVKTVDQQQLMALRSMHELLVRQRTALANQCRGLLAEFGICIPQGLGRLRCELARIVQEPLGEFPAQLCGAMARSYARLRELDHHIEQALSDLNAVAKVNPVCQVLMRRRGIGVLTACAVAAEVDPTHFRNGRHLSAWIGLVPRQSSSGGKPGLLGISKRGNTALRTLFIHGARAVVRTAAKKDDPLSVWIRQLCARRGVHKTIVAVANKTARHVWADLMNLRAGLA